MEIYPPEINKTRLAALKLLDIEIEICGDHWHLNKDRATIASRFRGTVMWDFHSQHLHEAKQVEEILEVPCGPR